MPRRPRLHLDGVPLRIVQRDHNRQACFFCKDDYFSYRHWLAEALAEHECSLHTYVLMTNHVHLLLTPKEAEAVPNLIISIGRRYVQYINRTCKHTGTLWDSRYKSSLVQAETYLLNCQRYIELNPVRAGLVQDPGQYRWTNYHANALGQTNSRISPHDLYLSLGRNAEERQRAYRALFRTALDQEAIADIRLAVNQNEPTGNGSIHMQVEKMLGVRREARPPGRPRAKNAPAEVPAFHQGSLEL